MRNNTVKNKTGLDSALMIAGGTIIGQGTLLVAIPFLTRLFTPNEMGLYAMFIAIAGVFAIVAALHYELVIPLPKSDLHARLITKIAIIIVVSVSLLTFCIIYVSEKDILDFIIIQSISINDNH